MGLPPRTKSWLKKEVTGWKDKSIITEEQTQLILEQYGIPYEAPKKEPANVIKVLSIIGAIILGLGIILFVASNWGKIPDLLKTVMLVALTLATFYLGYYFSFQRNDLPILGKSLFLLASLFYGGSTFLIAQIYNITANSHWLVLFWGLSIFPVAYFFKSVSTYILTSILFIVWDGLFNAANNSPNYFYPVLLFSMLFLTSKYKDGYNIPNFFGLFIAQIYALIHQYHWLILIWAAGALAYYFICKKRFFSVFAAVLLILWNISFFTMYEKLPNYFYIAPLAFIFYLAYKEKANALFATNLFGILVWANLFIFTLSKTVLPGKFEPLPFVIFQSCIAAVLYLLGVFHKAIKSDFFAAILKIFGLAIGLLVVYVLSFKFILEDFAKNDFRLYFFASIALLSISVLLIVANLVKSAFSSAEKKLELVAITLLLAMNLLLLFNPAVYTVNVVFVNAVLFIFAAIIVYYGFETQSPFIFNSGIMIFVIAIVTRYFDILWKLLPRSLFFIIGGTIIIIGSVFLEKKRRKTIQEMKG